MDNGSKSRETGRERITRRAMLSTAGALAPVALAGCIGGENPLSSDTENLPYHLERAWQSDRSTEYDGNHHDMGIGIVDDEPVIVAPHNDLDNTEGCSVTAVDSAGEAAWRDEIDPERCTPHAVGDIGVSEHDGATTFLAGTEAGDVVAIDGASGEVVFRSNVLDSLGYGAPVGGAFTGQNDTVTVDFRGGVFVLDGEGDLVWSADVDSQVATAPVLADVAGEGAPKLAVLHGDREGLISLFDVDGDRSILAEFEDSARTWTPVDTGASIDFIVAASETLLFVEGETGDVRWETHIGRNLRVGDADDEMVYTGSHDGKVRAVNLDGGTVRWETSVADGERVPAPVVGTLDASRIVAVTAYDGSVTILDEDGDRLAAAQLEDQVYVSPQVADVTGSGDDDVLVMDGKGRITALTSSRD